MKKLTKEVIMTIDTLKYHHVGRHYEIWQREVKLQEYEEGNENRCYGYIEGRLSIMDFNADYYIYRVFDTSVNWERELIGRFAGSGELRRKG